MKTIELDFSAIASVKMKCDNKKCGKVIGGRYSNLPNTHTLYLSDGEDQYGYPKTIEKNYCTEACILSDLSARAKK